MSELSTVTTEGEQVPDAFIAERNFKDSRTPLDVSNNRRICLSCGMPLLTGSFCSETCKGTYLEWVKQKKEYTHGIGLDMIGRFATRYGGAAMHVGEPIRA